MHSPLESESQARPNQPATAQSERQPPVAWTQGTTIPRHIAAIVDNFLASILAVICAQQMTGPYLQIVIALLVFLAYYFALEAVFCTTPAKIMNGLVVRRLDGGRPSIRQTLIRTLYRAVETNPLLLGGLPAAARVIWSSNKQRFGDKAAGTIVVFR